MNKSHMDKRLNQLPSWLWSNSTTLPPIYRTVWEAVREDKVRSGGMQTELLVDTKKVFPLLLTSQLSTEVLGHIWSLANQKYAGQLTEQELYIVLALVGAAQASYPFNRLDVLHLLPFPPTPYLNIECILNIQPTVQSNSTRFPNFINNETNVGAAAMDEKYITDTKGKITIDSNENTADINATLSSVSGKTSFDIRSHSTGMTIWNLNTVLRDSKQSAETESSNHYIPLTDVCDDFSEFQSAPIPNVPNVPIWDAKQGSAIGSRLANHNLAVKKSIEKLKKNNMSSKAIAATTRASVTLNSMSQKEQASADCSSELFPKCALKNQSKTVILKDTVIRSDDLSKDHSGNFMDHQANATDSRNISIKADLSKKIASVEQLDVIQTDLMNLQHIEDKYSALRSLVQETPSPNEESLNTDNAIPSTDEFGEFISAGNINVASTLDDIGRENLTDIFSDFEYSRSQNIDNDITDLKFISELSESFDNLKFEDEEQVAMDEKFELTVEIGKAILKEDAMSIHSTELINGVPEALTRSGSVPSLDLKSFLPSNVEEELAVETTNQSVYWEWKQYMESCVLLLQVAANIFTNISSETVLNEVLNSMQGYNFLCNLAEVAAVCRRVNFSYKEMDINIMGFDDLLMDIDRIWAEMEPFYTNIPIITELPAWPLHHGESVVCALCLTVITSGRITYNDNSYHASCANLWLNCVSNHLPTMRFPSFHTHSSMCTRNGSNI